jgi:hypothetical protein
MKSSVYKNQVLVVSLKKSQHLVNIQNCKWRKAQKNYDAPDLKINIRAL